MVKLAEPTTMEEARQFAALKPQTVFRLMGISKNVGWGAIHSGAIPVLILGPKTVRIPVRAWLDSLAEREA